MKTICEEIKFPPPYPFLVHIPFLFPYYEDSVIFKQIICTILPPTYFIVPTYKVITLYGCFEIIVPNLRTEIKYIHSYIISTLNLILTLYNDISHSYRVGGCQPSYRYIHNSRPSEHQIYKAFHIHRHLTVKSIKPLIHTLSPILDCPRFRSS